MFVGIIYVLSKGWSIVSMSKENLKLENICSHFIFEKTIKEGLQLYTGASKVANLGENRQKERDQN